RRDRDYERNEGSSRRNYSPRRRDERDQRDSNKQRPPRRDGRRQDRNDDDRRKWSNSPRPDSKPKGEQEWGVSRRSRSPPSALDSEKPKPKLEPNFKNSVGLLAAASNSVKHGDGTSTVLKYSEPPEARKPTAGWRLYVFKGTEQVDLLHLHRQSAYLAGRDRAVTDIHTEHPSCSKQHAALQFRQIIERNEFGDSKTVIKPFIIDLESTNGTHVNDTEIPTSRYYELQVGDVIKFGQSTREYVLLND
ncbi:SMAD/FHA domain-containing protein, partial [Clavulina sp. PMI_390]